VLTQPKTPIASGRGGTGDPLASVGGSGAGRVGSPPAGFGRAARLGGLAGPHGCHPGTKHACAVMAEANAAQKPPSGPARRDSPNATPRPLGEMKGAAMKVGPDPLLRRHRRSVVRSSSRDVPIGALARLQDDVSTAVGARDRVGDREPSSVARPEDIFAFFSPPGRSPPPPSARFTWPAWPTAPSFAVKVQYPGVADAIRGRPWPNTDMLALDHQSRCGSARVPARRGSIPRPWSTRCERESERSWDYRVEAANQQEFAAILRRASVHPDSIRPSRALHRPSSHHGLRGAVGVGHQRSTRTRHLRWRWGETIFRFVFGSLHRHGVFNADPAPGELPVPRRRLGHVPRLRAASSGSPPSDSR